eukprot:784344_1
MAICSADYIHEFETASSNPIHHPRRIQKGDQSMRRVIPNRYYCIIRFDIEHQWWWIGRGCMLIKRWVVQNDGYLTTFGVHSGDCTWSCKTYNKEMQLTHHQVPMCFVSTAPMRVKAEHESKWLQGSARSDWKNRAYFRNPQYGRQPPPVHNHQRREQRNAHSHRPRHNSHGARPSNTSGPHNGGHRRGYGHCGGRRNRSSHNNDGHNNNGRRGGDRSNQHRRNDHRQSGAYGHHAQDRSNQYNGNSSRRYRPF